MKEITNFVRINSRIPEKQYLFIKKRAKNRDIGDGELHREIIKFYMDHHK